MKNSTYLKYLLSYLSILTVLLLGFFFIIRNQLSQNYYTQLCHQTQVKQDTLTSQLNDDITSLSQIDDSIRSNSTLLLSRYRSELSYRYEAVHDLKNYTLSSPLISSIVYADLATQNIISTDLTVTYHDGIFSLTRYDLRTVSFDPSSYLDTNHGQIILLSDGSLRHCIYFPATHSTQRYLFFYLLDITSMQNLLQSHVSEAMPALVILDAQGNIITGKNTNLIASYLEDLPHEDGIYNIDAANSICLNIGKYHNFSLVSLLSVTALKNQIDLAFAKAYLILLLLCLLGLLLICLSMRSTYHPLYKLISKNVPEIKYENNFLEQLDQTITNMQNKNQQLTEKLDDYRLFMQKLLFDSILSSSQLDANHSLPDIDKIFDADPNKSITLVYICTPDAPLSCNDLLKSLQGSIPKTTSFFLLEANQTSAVFIIIQDNLNHGHKALIEALTHLHYEQRCLSAVSHTTHSPLDIPQLYEEIHQASSQWPQFPIVDYEALPRLANSFFYPYDKLNQLSESLRDFRLSDARQLINLLFETIRYSGNLKRNLPTFFSSCILLDILTVLTNTLNHADIKFGLYDTLYFETLYLCRRFTQDMSADKIYGNFQLFLDLYEKAAKNSPGATQIRQMMDSSFSDPNFSISQLADHFQISTTHMSNTFQKVMGQNFSNYLWSLRLEKAKSLMADPNMSINEISIAIGYPNDTSFRRRFKQETGMTPSEYRCTACGDPALPNESESSVHATDNP